MENKKIGSVMVIGAGIAGIQSSLDLADSGFKVYLLEESPAIGGKMAQLDKTFPTNDCAMCVVSPKLVECGRHLNIELLTNSELISLKGDVGNFVADIYKKPRFVDLEKCTGCGECAEVCPVNTVSIFDENLIEKTAIYKPYPQASPNAFVIDKNKTAPCQLACPSGIHVQGYIALVAEGKYKEAYNLIRRNNPFVSVCGRVCFHPCETDCRRGEYDDPLAIASIKRFIADYVHTHHDEMDKKEDAVVQNREKVAVIGGGPAGLTCAFYLAQKGYKVTVFEKDEKAGGMMRSCIPPYRLSRDELDWEIEQIVKEGVELKTNVNINSEEKLNELRAQGFKAFYIAIGAQVSKALRVEGEELKGVIGGIDFLKNVYVNEQKLIGKKVAVVGGGNTAIDCARTAIRLGADVTLIYRRTRREMPAESHEIRDAAEEGVKFRFLTNPVKVNGENGEISSILFDKMELGEPDSSGRRRPKPTGEQFTESFDNMLVAVSQTSDLNLLEKSEVNTTSWNTIKTDSLTYQTNIKDIFAGGDVVLGPASVVEAVGQASEAAISIDRFLRKADISSGREKKKLLPAREYQTYVPEEKRTVMRSQKATKRIGNFDETELGYTEEEVRKEASRCLDCGICSSCLQCVEVCEAGAIIHDMMPEKVAIEIGSVIIATGADTYDPTEMHEYGFGRYKNVMTSIQFERVLAASGPFEGHLQRPSDGEVPRKIAWIQCVGSRTEDSHMPYCSSVCCMYAMKEAIIAKEHVSTVEPTIFFMDIRAHGKDFDKYYDKAKDAGINFKRGRIGKIREIADSKNLELYYAAEKGKVTIEEFDLVVLSVGLHPQKSIQNLSESLNARLNEFSFIDHVGISQIKTSRPGVFVCGPAVSPKDIPETVTQSSGAVAESAEILSEVRGTEISEKVYPTELNVSGQKPRIGVFVCHCGINISSVVDIPTAVDFAKSLPNVVYATDNLFTCSQDTQQVMKEKIIEHKLNRVVVASCSPSTHEALFQETLREIGLNPHLFEMANIRNQCSWVHKKEPAKATDKANTLIKIAVAKSRLQEPLHSVALHVTQKGLVIGGGLAGMTSALSIANQGFECALVERETELGGNLNGLFYTLDGQRVPDYLQELKDQIEDHPLIKVFLNSKITGIEGYIGNFKTSMVRNEEELEYLHGVIVIATGAKESKPNEYYYDSLKNVITQRELETELEESEDNYKKIKRTVFIQCVGSRDENHPYCSRICCSQAVKNAIRLKKINPKMDIMILYRDMRTFGFYEKYYQQAREEGIIFIRYTEDQKPVIEIDDKKMIFNEDNLILRVRDHVLGTDICINPQRIILSQAIEPREDVEVLSQMLKIPLNEDKFFMEAHVKLRPVDFSVEGLFLAGLAHSPKGMEDSISQAKGAAERACSIISSNEYMSEANIAVVDRDLCAGCGMCVSVCPYDAPELIWLNGKEYAYINSALCKGCGSCAAVCPSGAMQQLGYKEEQTIAMLNEALELW